MTPKLPLAQLHPPPWIRALARRLAAFDKDLRIANRARDQRHWAIAAAHYQRVVDRRPYLPRLRVQLGHMLKEMGRYAEAEKQFEAFRAVRPHDADIHLQFGHMLRRQSRVEEARPWFERALCLAPALSNTAEEARAALEGHERALVDARVRKALQLADSGEHSAARLRVQTLVEVDGRTDLTGILGNLSKELGLFEDARVYYDLYSKAAQTAFEKFDSQVQWGHLEKIEGNYLTRSVTTA